MCLAPNHLLEMGLSFFQQVNLFPQIKCFNLLKKCVSLKASNQDEAGIEVLFSGDVYIFAQGRIL